MGKLNPRQIATKALNSAGTAVLSPPYGGFGYYYNHGPRNQRKVALTFDDGPNKPSTENLLNALDELGVRGTFFCIGWQVKCHPDLVRRMYETGHVVANHSMEHRRGGSLKISGGEHIDASEREIIEVIGRRPRLYRPPWGWLTPWEGQRLLQRGYAVIGWDVYTYDWKVPEVSGSVLAEGVYRDVKPGSIILMHDSNGIIPVSNKIEMTRAVQELVPRLRAEGYEFVTVPELLGMPAYIPIIR
jgi:peptidoglycan/xylan/chitin deacetylase (PgdA/CDA1 family)